jgi:hypothetical protein
MKNILALVASLMILKCQGQGIRLTAFSGIASSYPVESYHDSKNYYEGELQAGFKAGIDVEYVVDKNFSFGLLYMHQQTTVPVVFYLNTSQFYEQFDMKLNWFMVGCTGILPTKRFEALFGTHVGVGVLHLSDPNLGASTTQARFGWGVKGGINIFPLKKVGIHLGSDALFSFHSIPDGSVNSQTALRQDVAGYDWLFQFSFLGGLVFKLGKTGAKK